MQPAPAWSWTPGPAGVTFTWNRNAPELKAAARIGLILHGDSRVTYHALDRSSGTLIIPEAPEAAVLRVDDRQYSLYGREPRPEQIPPSPVMKTRAPRNALSLRMRLNGARGPVVSTAAVVLPRVPSYVRRPLDIDLAIKVTPQGVVSSVASHYGNDPLRNKLSALASKAISRWQFDPIAAKSYREGRLRLVFMPDRVVVRPSPVG